MQTKAAPALLSNPPDWYAHVFVFLIQAAAHISFSAQFVFTQWNILLLHFSNCCENIDFLSSRLQPRLNPFNRASIIVVEQHENNSGLTAGREQDSSDTGSG